MQTEILKAEDKNTIQRAAEHLKQGRLVAFPTDTVYGVGALAFDETAIGRLYAAKQRPLHKAIPILFSDLEILDALTAEVPEWTRPLMQTHWPGPLTLILPKKETLPANISPNAGIALRVPNSKIARDLIRAAGGALATSSANLSGELPAQAAAEAYASLKSVVAAVVDGGTAAHGTASTILDCLQFPPRVVRSGPIKFEPKDFGFPT